MRYGCLPLLKNNASHPELVDGIQDFLFAPDMPMDEQVQKLEDLMWGYPSRTPKVEELARNYDTFPMATIISTLKELAHASQ